jgi:hypothetical protein
MGPHGNQVNFRQSNSIILLHMNSTFRVNTQFFHIWQSSFRIERQTVTDQEISESHVGKIGGPVVLPGSSVLEHNILKQA